MFVLSIFFLSMFSDVSVICRPIFKIIFALEIIHDGGGPILTKASDNGIPSKSRAKATRIQAFTSENYDLVVLS